MIINLRGTSGAGKSTIVKNIMDRFGTREPFFVSNRKRPLGYVCYRPGQRSLGIVGHYEIACGGCDTISQMGDVFGEVRRLHAAGLDVLFEGAIVSTLARDVIELHQEGYPLSVVSLNTPLEDCLKGIQARRDARNDDRPLNPLTTTRKFASVKSTHRKFEAAGVPAIWATRDEAEAFIVGALGL